VVEGVAMVRAQPHPRWSWAGLLLALLAAALWGLAPVATKGALRGFSPEFIGCFRLALAACIFRLLAGNGARWFVADPWVCVSGVALGVDFVLYNYGLQLTPANVAGLVINIEVVSTIGLAVWLLGERLTPRHVLGAAVTLAGVVVVSSGGLSWQELKSGPPVGNLLVMAAGVAWSLYAVAQRRSAYGTKLFERLTAIFSVAALTAAPGLLRRSAWDFAGGFAPTLMLIVLTLFCTALVYLAYARVQQLIDVSVLAVLLCLIPVFAVVFAYVLLGEPLTATLVLGGSLVLAGIAVIAAEQRRAPEVEWYDSALRVPDASRRMRL
jgi:drug/metabolite transporter (DMT)-like permease